MLAPLLLTLLLVPLCLATGYLLLLTLLSARRRPPAAGGSGLRFTVVVPAHDEAAGIARTIRSLLALRWPEAQRRVLVVADNCSDRTAACAMEAGAQVIERIDVTRQGKGHALTFAFEHLLAEGWSDAVVVVDADTAVAPGLLADFAAHIAPGARAMQAFYGVLNPDASWRTRLATIALAIFHRLRGRGREALGLSCGLRGNGMCFTVDTLRRVPHRAFSIVEDLEYGIQLGRAGIRVEYVDEAEVRGEMVSSARAARSQRRRWEGGRARMARIHGLPLLIEAVRRRSLLLLDLALDLLIPPLGVIAVASLLLAVAGAVLGGMGRVHPLLAGAAWVPASILVLHVVRGAVLSGLGWRAAAALAAAPVYVLWKLSLKLRARTDAASWVRTDREAAPDDRPPDR